MRDTVGDLCAVPIYLHLPAASPSFDFYIGIDRLLTIQTAASALNLHSCHPTECCGLFHFECDVYERGPSVGLSLR